MKKWMKAAAGLSLLALVLTGCGNQTTVTVDTAALADRLCSEVTWNDQLGEVELSKALGVYGIQEDAVASGKVYMGTNATAEEIAVLEAVSEDRVADLEAGVQARVEAQLESFESYNAAEVPKLENPLIETRGNYVILCVCDDTAEAEAVIEASFAE